MLGNPGQNLRPRLAFDELEQEPPEIEGWRPALPSGCLRRLASPRPDELGCGSMCEGRQRDGGCLCDIVKAANDAGVRWTFEIDRDLYWVYTGPELPEPEPET